MLVWVEVCRQKNMHVKPLLQRQVLTLDGATGLPALYAVPVCTGMPNRLGGTDSCEDRGRLLLLAETEEVEEAAQPSGAELIPRGCGCALQKNKQNVGAASAACHAARNPHASLDRALHACQRE